MVAALLALELVSTPVTHRVGALLGGPTPLGDGTSVSPHQLAELLRASAVDGPIDVVVQLNLDAGASAGDVEAAADRLVDQVDPPQSEPVTVLGDLRVLAMTATGEDLQQLARSSLVAKVEPDLLLAPALDRSTAQIGAPAAWGAGFSGAGRAVAVIDSGVDSTHPALVKKVIHEACFSNASCPNGQSTMTGPGAAVPCRWGNGCEHGTHVAGIIAAAATPIPPSSPPSPVPTGGGVRQGVAPGADLISLQVFSLSNSAGCGAALSCPRARTSDVLAALNHVNQLATTNAVGEPIVAVNLSLASETTSLSCNESILAGAVDTLWRNGVATVVAAGNSANQSQLSVPACITSSVSVGAVDQNNAYWPVSNASPSLDFFAPGVNVVSTWPGGGWQAASGTSTAAPHAAGAWAVASQALRSTNPDTIHEWFRRQPGTITVASTTTPRLSLTGLAALGGSSGGSPVGSSGGVPTSGPSPATPATSTVTQWANPQNMTSLVGDYDGNGYEDVYWFDRSGAATQIWWFGSTGREQITQSAMAGNWRPVSGDFNGDRVGDIIWYDPTGPTYFWFGRRSRGQFEGTGPFYPWGNFSPVSGDFDGDGDDDVYLYDRDSAASFIFWMGPTPGWPGFATVGSVGLPQSPGPGFTPVAGDFDGDGDADLYWAGRTAAHLEWSNRDASFVRNWAVSGDYQVIATQLDTDRFSDLILYGHHNTWLWWGGIDRSNSYPRQGKWLDLDHGANAVAVAGRFMDPSRDSLYLYGPATPADTFYRPSI